MATKDSFTVNVAKGTGVSVTWDKPDSLADVTWEQRVSGEHGEKVTVTMSKDVARAINDLAIQQLVIKIQGSARSALPQGRAAVQGKVNAYKYGARGSSTPPPTVDAKAAGLSKAQCELLEKQGIVILNMPAK